MKHSKFPYLVLTPMLAILFTFTVLPIIGSFVIAFMDYNPLRAVGNSFVGFSNFVRFFSDELFKKSLGNTLYFVVMMTVTNIVITLIIAQLLSALSSNRWRSLFRVMFFMPCVAPLAAVSIIWMRSILPIKGGLLNMALIQLGIAPVNWLGSAGMIMTSIMILTQWADLGYNIILFIAGIQGIPDTFYEAAKIDGAGPFRRFFAITLPLLNKTFSFVFIMTLISEFQAFAQFSIVAKDGGPGRAGYVLSTYIYNTGFANKDLGYASAISVALFLIIMTVTLIQRRMVRVDWGY